MGAADAPLSVGEVARRAGVSVPTLRYYGDRGLLSPARDTGNRRVYPRSVLRRLAFVAAAQRVGLSLDEIRECLARLPGDRTPTRRDWAGLSLTWRARLDGRIRELEALREDLDGCIGCGCLSLRRCALYNRGDEAAAEGPGSRWMRQAREDRTGAAAPHDDGA